jgi:hypothetical protein
MIGLKIEIVKSKELLKGEFYNLYKLILIRKMSDTSNSVAKHICNSLNARFPQLDGTANLLNGCNV